MKLTLEKYEDSSVHWWLKELEKAVDENKQRESKGEETTGLDEEPPYISPWVRRYIEGVDKDRRDGGVRGRRASDRDTQKAIPILNRVQKPREIQRNIWGIGSSSYPFEHGTTPSDKDESS